MNPLKITPLNARTVNSFVFCSGLWFCPGLTVKKVSFLKIFPPSPESSSWCSESSLVVKYFSIYVYSCRFKVWGFKRSFINKSCRFRSISNIFWSNGIKRFLFLVQRRPEQSQALPKQLQTILHPSIIPDNSSIYNNCICWKVLLLRK